MSIFKPTRPAPPPPNLPQTDKLRGYFDSVDQDKSGTIAPKELQAALVNGNKTEFNMTTINMMIDLFDHDKSGEICFKEFGALWGHIRDWQNCFESFDRDRNWGINQEELETALSLFGYSLGKEMYGLLTRKFDRTQKNELKFDDFIQCCLFLNGITAKFNRQDTEVDGEIIKDYEKYLISRLALPITNIVTPPPSDTPHLTTTCLPSYTVEMVSLGSDLDCVEADLPDIVVPHLAPSCPTNPPTTRHKTDRLPTSSLMGVITSTFTGTTDSDDDDDDDEFADAVEDVIGGAVDDVWGGTGAFEANIGGFINPTAGFENNFSPFEENFAAFEEHFGGLSGNIGGLGDMKI